MSSSSNHELKTVSGFEIELAQNQVDALAELKRFYNEVDQQASRVSRCHGTRLKCQIGCTQCCVDGLTVFEVEAQNIRSQNAILLREQNPNPEGACAFLGEGGSCRIYADRPYMCRTQGLPIRWIEEIDSGEVVELRDICPLNDEGTPIEELPEAQCWTIGPSEIRLAVIQEAFAGGETRRVLLRSLFSLTDENVRLDVNDG